MEAVATAVLDEKERERQEQIKKLQNETCFIGHPFGVGVMNFKFMMGQITGYGMTAIFIYYLYAAAPAGVGLTKVQASQIITLDAALASIFSIVGSFMADRVFGNRRAYRFCTITGPFFYFSLAIPRLGIVGVVLYCCIGYMNSMVAGSSMYSLLGKLYAQGDKRRDGAFSIQYVLSNIGAMFPVVIGSIALVVGYQKTFFILGIVGALGSAVYLALEKRAFGPIGMEPDDPLPPEQKKKAVAFLILGVLAFGGLLFLLFTNDILTISSFSNIVSVVTLCLPAIYFVYMLRSKKTSDSERKRLPYLIPMFITGAFSMMVWYQSATILAIYAETSVDLNFFGFQAPPSVFMTIQAIMAIVIGIICTGLWSKLGRRQPSTPWKAGFGTMLYGLGALIMVIPFQLYAPGVKVSPFWMIAFYFVMIIGEAVSYPAGTSAASQLAPAAFSTQMMTIWGFSVTAGANLANLVSNFYHEGSEGIYFLGIGGSTVLAGVILLFFEKRLAKGMGLSEGGEAEAA